eukprot:sb/3470364/
MSKLATWLKKEKETNILRQVSALKTDDPLENWELTTEIGDGAFGTVYKARHTSDPTLVAAVKSIPISEDEDDEQYSTELLVLAQCSHDNIVRLLDCYLHNQQIYVSSVVNESGQNQNWTNLLEVVEISSASILPFCRSKSTNTSLSCFSRREPQDMKWFYPLSLSHPGPRVRTKQFFSPFQGLKYLHRVTTNQNSLFRSHDWLSAN